ncbi:MAG: PadR family transcriptional regulator [Promethearchaeota archaeon]
MGINNNLKVQNLTKLYTLVLLKSNDSVTGYYILKRLGSDLGKTSSPTYIYNFLKKLKEKGYIEEITTKNNERSKGYRLTSLGSEFTNKIFSRFDNLIDVAIQSRLEICSSCGVRLYKDYYTEMINGKKLNFCCKHCANAYKTSL